MAELSRSKQKNSDEAPSEIGAIASGQTDTSPSGRAMALPETRGHRPTVGISGVHLTREHCRELLAAVRKVPVNFYDGLVLSGRNGAFLAGYMEGCETVIDKPITVVRSVDRSLISLYLPGDTDSWIQLEPEQLRWNTIEIGELIHGSMVDVRSRDEFAKWLEQNGQGPCPVYSPVRLLFIDDSVSPSPTGTLEYIKAATQAWGSSLVGWIATDHFLQNDMGGFHPIRHLKPCSLRDQEHPDALKELLIRLPDRDSWEEKLLASLSL